MLKMKILPRLLPGLLILAVLAAAAAFSRWTTELPGNRVTVEWN